MPQVTVHETEFGKAAIVNPFFLRMEDTLEAVRKRAFQLFEERGPGPGGEVGDRLQAERDLFFVPNAEIAEADKNFTLKLAMDGFAGRDVEVMTSTREIVVRAESEKCTSEQCSSRGAGGAACHAASKPLYRHFDMPAMIDADSVEAHLDNGVLIIDVPKRMSPSVLVRSGAA
jgi:HSP20 family molecular chaperone IbpA